MNWLQGGRRPLLGGCVPLHLIFIFDDFFCVSRGSRTDEGLVIEGLGDWGFRADQKMAVSRALRVAGESVHSSVCYQR